MQRRLIPEHMSTRVTNLMMTMHGCSRASRIFARRFHAESERWKRMKRRACRKSLASYVKKFNASFGETFARDSSERRNRERSRSEKRHGSDERTNSSHQHPCYATQTSCIHRKALGIGPNIDIDLKLLKEAFRRKAFACHPDMQEQPEHKMEASAQFQTVRDAYERLVSSLGTVRKPFRQRNGTAS